MPGATIAGIALLALVLRDAFETIILPRRVRRIFQLTSVFYRTTWKIWRAAATGMKGKYRENSLSWYGPFSLLMLLVVWALTIVFAFGLLHYGAGSALKMDGGTPGFLDDLYLSGTTFFTLGMGDVVPRVAAAKFITVFEAGLGFAFLAIRIGKTWSTCSLNGNAGRPRCSRVIFRIRCWHTSGRSTATSRGSPRSPPFSTPARW